jgi:predicted double-glycine peptidase
LYNKDLVKILKDFNFKVLVKTNSSWKSLNYYNKPRRVVIVSWMLKGYIGHFSVVDRVAADSIYLADPESGKIIKINKLVFLRLWLDYDPLWYPKKNTDITLRWMAVISK